MGAAAVVGRGWAWRHNSPGRWDDVRRDIGVGSERAHEGWFAGEVLRSTRPEALDRATVSCWFGRSAHHSLRGRAITPPQIAGKAARGYWVIYGLPVAAIVCFLFPRRLTWWLSPRPPPLYEYLITDGVWYVLGYCLLAVGIGVLLLFR